jgi:hypothetical protein
MKRILGIPINYNGIAPKLWLNKFQDEVTLVKNDWDPYLSIHFQAMQNLIY